LNKISNQKNIKIYKSQLDISTFYLESSFLVVASEYESFSLVTAEALFYKLPVVGFQNCIGLNELIEHNSNGILVEHKGRKSINLYNQLFDIIASKSYEVLSRDNTKIISKYEIYNVIKKWNNLFDRI
ncbi:glycosyltransferase, partial [Pelagibacteraceae bacterium]|nr:glycosyltransferase [Pelagibacteraceae bacterium]